MRRRRRILVAVLSAPWVLWALARTLGLDSFHPLVAAIAFTPYAAATAIVPLVVALVARAWIVAALAALAMAALTLAVAPRALDGPQLAEAGAPGRPLVVMTSNLLFGRADARAVMRLAREHDVDVLSLQELTPGAVVGLDAEGARKLFGGRVLHPGSRAAGTGLMTRRPLHAVVGEPAGSEQLQAALTLPGARALQLVAVHPYPPISGASVRDWKAVLRGLPGPTDGGRPHVLLGDFNATLDQRALRDVLDRGYTDAADATGDGLRPTFPVASGRRGGAHPLITIDHVLVPDTIRVRRATVYDVPGSDHRALIVELVLPAG